MLRTFWRSRRISDSKAIETILIAVFACAVILSPEACGQCSGPLTFEVEYFEFIASRDVVSADFNGDGFADLAAPRDNPRDVVVRLGFGDGTFEQPLIFDLGDAGEPHSLTTGDFNGDNIVDLATANTGNSNGTVSVLLGNGNGTFAPPNIFPAGFNPDYITTADFNNDGTQDLAVSNGGSANPGPFSVSVLLGNGNGTFNTFQQTNISALRPVFLTSADFNGDSLPDVATANFDSHNLTVLIGLGNGTFVVQGDIALGGPANSVTTGDFNSDGIVDLVGTNRVMGSVDSVNVLLGNGDGTFTNPQTYAVGEGASHVVVNDFNGDKLSDIVVTNGSSDDIGLLFSHGDGTFAPLQTFKMETAPGAIAANDFNGDNLNDLVGTGSNTISVLLNTCDLILLGDVNGDGTVDLLDVQPFVDLLTSNEFQAEADVNQDGMVDLLDIAPFVYLLISP